MGVGGSSSRNGTVTCSGNWNWSCPPLSLIPLASSCWRQAIEGWRGTASDIAETMTAGEEGVAVAGVAVAGVAGVAGEGGWGRPPCSRDWIYWICSASCGADAARRRRSGATCAPASGCGLNSHS